MTTNYYNIVLPTFNTQNYQQEVSTAIENVSYIFYFNYNIIESNLFLSCYTSGKANVYFASLRCVFGNYLNLFDNGFPYLVYFIDKSGNNYQNITFDALNNGVYMYAKSR